MYLVVGDVHGCFDELSSLDRRYGSGRRLVLVGDLVAKGPSSAEVVAYARARDAWAVLGNHDARLLKARRGQAPGSEHEGLVPTFREEDWAYLEALPLWLRLDEGTVVVHGGLVPGIALERQERRHLLTLRSLRDGRPSSKVDGTPWAARWPGPEHVLFGHDAVRGLQLHPHATGLDSGCVYGGQLTAALWPERRLVTEPARRVHREPR